MKNSLRILFLTFTIIFFLIGCKNPTPAPPSQQFTEYTTKLHGWILTFRRCDSILLASRNECMAMDSKYWAEYEKCLATNLKNKDAAIAACPKVKLDFWSIGANGKPIHVQGEFTDPTCKDEAQSKKDKQDLICQNNWKLQENSIIECLQKADNIRSQCISEWEEFTESD